MKLKLTVLFAMLLMIAGARAQTPTTNSYFQSVNADILDDNPNGVYSTINVQGLYGGIAGISVTVNITNGFNGDLYGFLANSQGDIFAVLLNRPGLQAGNSFGYTNAGFYVTFSDTATNDIHFYQSGSYNLDANGALTGTWAPDGRNIDPGTDPDFISSAARTNLLGSFLGTDPNGDWTLFLSDFSGGYQSTLKDWQLNILTIPEPATGQLVAMGALGIICFARRDRKPGMNS